jgi:hypothetical protein
VKRKQYRTSHQVNQVAIEFTNKPITAWGGIASIVAKFLEQVEFRSWVEEHVPIEERSNNARGIYPKVLAQFLTALVGGSRFAHLSWWGHGVEAVKETFGVKWLPGAQSVLTRFWNKIGTQALSERLSESARSLAVKLTQWEGIGEDSLNLDSSVFTRYGMQEGAKRGYNPKKRGRPSHHPLMAFLGSGYVVNLWNRSGDAGAGQGAVAFLRQTLLALGERFGVKRVLCDSGFYLIEFIKHLESNGFTYTIAAPMMRVLQWKIYAITQWHRVDDGIDVADFEFEHRDEKWEHPRRYVVVRQKISTRPKAPGKQLLLFEQLEEMEDYRFSIMITNDTESSPEEVWRGYRPRANIENVLKDLIEGYGAAAFNLHNFWATESVMVMNALVFHNLLHYLNRKVLNPNKPLQQLKTLRSKYFIIPAQLGSGAGRSVLRLAVRDRKLRAKLHYFLERITALPCNLNCIAVKTQGCSLMV